MSNIVNETGHWKFFWVHANGRVHQGRGSLHKGKYFNPEPICLTSSSNIADPFVHWIGSPEIRWVFHIRFCFTNQMTGSFRIASNVADEFIVNLTTIFRHEAMAKGIICNVFHYGCVVRTMDDHTPLISTTNGILGNHRICVLRQMKMDWITTQIACIDTNIKM